MANSKTQLPKHLRKDDAFRLRDRVQAEIERAPLRSPHLGETEKAYVAAAIRPVLEKMVVRYRQLRILGEGGKVAPPVHFLSFYFYPDLAIMYYEQRLVAIEAKFVDFSRSVGALATAVGQGVVYSIEGYVTSLVLVIGRHTRHTDNCIKTENARLAATGAPWRICAPRVLPMRSVTGA